MREPSKGEHGLKARLGASVCRGKLRLRQSHKAGSSVLTRGSYLGSQEEDGVRRNLGSRLHSDGYALVQGK